MTFSEASAVSPIPEQPFLWMAEYIAGSFTEFDLETGKENKFQDIEKEKLVRFGLIGNRRKMWFEAIGGTFYIAGRRIDIAFEDKNKVRYPLTGNGGCVMHDVITYKRAVADVPIGIGNKKASLGRSGLLASRIVGYYYGYKAQMELGGVRFSFKPIVSLPLGKAAYIEVNLSADQDMEGRVIFNRNREDIESFDGKLCRGKTNRLNWLIK